MRRPLRIILIIIVLLILLKIVTTALAGLELYQSAIALRDQAAQADPAALTPAVERFTRAAGRAAAEAAPAAPVLRLFGGDGCAAAGLIDVAGSAARFGEALAPLSGVALETFRNAAPTGIDIRALREAWNPTAVESARAGLDELVNRLSCDGASLSMTRYTSAARGGVFLLDLLSILPIENLLRDGSHWVIALQNTDELRATGGFTTALVAVSVTDGILRWQLMNVYEVDDLDLVYYHPYPPEPLRRFMVLQRLMFRDANWSPDHPTAAAQALSLYKLDQHLESVDGLVTVNMTALRTLIEFLPPLTVNGELMTPDSSLDIVREAWNTDAATLDSTAPDRKDFLLEVLAGFIAAVQSQVSPLDAALAVNVLPAMLERRDVMLYAVDPALQAEFAARGWDGSLPPSSGDALIVIESNLGFNKVTPRVERDITYTVDLSGDVPRADLTARYTNTNEPLVGCDKVHFNWDVSPDPDAESATTTYTDRMIGCYWNYIRAYVPRGARVESYAAEDIPGAWIIFSPSNHIAQIDAIREGEFDGFGLMTVTPPGDSRQIEIAYTLPETVLRDENGMHVYTLTVPKQPGVPAANLTINVTLPEGAESIEASPDAQVEGNRVTRTLTQTADAQFSVRYR